MPTSVLYTLWNVVPALRAFLGRMGDSNRQRELLERALAIQERKYGTEHAQVLSFFTPLRRLRAVRRSLK